MENQNKELCDCNEIATWCYMPSSSYKINPYYCEDCVPRGCDCNEYKIERETPEGEENKDWKWVDKNRTCSSYRRAGKRIPMYRI